MFRIILCGGSDPGVLYPPEQIFNIYTERCKKEIPEIWQSDSEHKSWIGSGGQIGLGTDEVVHTKDPLSKIQMGPQWVVAGGSPTKTGGGTGKAIHAILSSSSHKCSNFL